MWKHIKGSLKRFVNLIAETLTTGGAVLELFTVYAAAFTLCDSKNKECTQNINQTGNYFALSISTGVLGYQFIKYVFMCLNRGRDVFDIIDKGKECVVDMVAAHSFNLQLAFFIHTAIARAISNDPNQQIVMPDWQFWAFHFPPTFILAITSNAPARRFLQYKFFGACCAPCGRPELMSTLIQDEINQNQRSTNQKIFDIGHEGLKGLAAGHGWIHQLQDLFHVILKIKEKSLGGVWIRLGIGGANALWQTYIAYHYTPLKSSDDIFRSSIPANIQTILTAVSNTALTWSSVLSEEAPHKNIHAIWYVILYGLFLLYALFPEPSQIPQPQIFIVNNDEGGDDENATQPDNSTSHSEEAATETTSLINEPQTSYEATRTLPTINLTAEPTITIQSNKITKLQIKLFTIFKENINNENEVNKEFKRPPTLNAFVK